MDRYRADHYLWLKTAELSGIELEKASVAQLGCEHDYNFKHLTSQLLFLTMLSIENIEKPVLQVAHVSKTISGHLLE